jgi:molecular chaperone HscA
MLPSIIGYKDELSFFGKQAKDFESIANFKKFISNPDEESELPKKIVDGICVFFVGNRWRSITEISADLFLHLRHTTNAQLSENIRNAILCVPARFDDYQRQLVVKAATKAGWRILRVVSEPTAGFLGQEEIPDGEFGVADLGGGTFDFSIVKSEEKVIQVIYTSGNMKIGGCHIDKLAHKVFAKAGVTMEQIIQLRETGDCVSIEKDLKKEIVYLIKDASEQMSLECLKIIKNSPQVFSEIILIGGASELLANSLLEAGYKIRISSQKQLQVARGAARQAYKLQTRASPYLLLDVTPLSLGIEILNDEVEWIIPKNSPIPIAKKVIFTNVHDQQTHIKFKVVQGDSDFASKCRNLGEFELEIEKRKAGSVKLEIRFIVNADGMITIRAKNLDTEELREIKVSS